MSNKNLAFAGAFACLAVATAATALYFMKKEKTIENEDIEEEQTDKLSDPYFSTQNLQLYSTEAEKRDETVANVSYDLTLALSAKQ